MERLRDWLGTTSQTLRASALALLELEASRGCVLPAWRQWTPWARAPGAIAADSFERLIDDPRGRVRPASRAELQLLGAPFDDCAAATLIVLQVEPPLSPRPDALLIALHAREEGLDLTHLNELIRALEQGLSADRRARIAEAVFRAVEQAADPIELTDSEARLLYANAAWEQTFGHPAREAVGQTVGRLFRDPVAPIHDAAFYQFTLATLADGRSWSGALACRARDGSRVLCEPMVSPFCAQEQGFAGNFAVRRNLAQRAERDTALAIAHHEFRAVLAAIPEGVAVLREGKIYFVNAALLDLAQRDESDVIGRSYAELVHPEDRAPFEEVLETGVKRVRIARDDGSVRFAEISTAGMVSFEGKTATILLARDVTEQRVAQEQLARAEKLSALGALAAGVAHEINNPLAYISLNLRYLQTSEGLKASARDALASAVDGARRIQDIVAELRNYSAPDSPGPPEPISVAKAVTSAVNIVQNEIRHRASLERSVPDDLFVVAREGQLVQVLINLLVNAAHAIAPSSDEDHLIQLNAKASPEGTVVIEVSDTGVGIDASQLAHVFDPFSTTKARGEGSGLGLAISKRIVDVLGGKISLQSRVGEGSTARIELPRVLGAPAAAGERSDGESDALAVTDERIRLLIVDDEVLLAQTLERVLCQFDVTTVFCANDAIELFRARKRFDVVLCDLMMPGVPGPELYEQACRLDPHLSSRFVFMTGGVFTEHARDFLERSHCPILSKPFTMDDAGGLVERLAQRHGQRIAP